MPFVDFWSLITVKSFGSGEWIYTDEKWDGREISELSMIDLILRFRCRIANKACNTFLSFADGERKERITRFIRDTAAARRSTFALHISWWKEQKTDYYCVILMGVPPSVIIEKLYSLLQTAIPIIVFICKFSIFCFSSQSNAGIRLFAHTSH